MSKISHLPRIVVVWANLHDAWIVGSAAAPNAKDTRDVDVMVPWVNWSVACVLIPRNAVSNSLGGWKFQEDNVTVDVWPDTLDRLAKNDLFQWAWHPSSGRRLILAEDK